MEWQRGDRSNIEDMRGRSGFGAIHLGIGGVIVVGLLSWATGTNWFSVLGLNDTGSFAGRHGNDWPDSDHVAP